MPRLIKIDDKHEKKVHVHEDYGGGSEQMYYIVCPNCSEKVYVKGY